MAFRPLLCTDRAAVVTDALHAGLGQFSGAQGRPQAILAPRPREEGQFLATRGGRRVGGRPVQPHGNVAGFGEGAVLRGPFQPEPFQHFS